MEKGKDSDKILLPHHVQQQLCDTRLAYRQGRRLTAIKVYSIAKESNHLLIFGVPSLNLRQETKVLFVKFGKLVQFNISKDHAAEPFTETYHAQYEKIQSARLAKRVLDTKNFYGGSLHVCYAPEMESIDETHQKIIQRQNDVLWRLKKLKNDDEEFIQEVHSTNNSTTNVEETQNCDKNLLNMGENNFVVMGSGVKRNQRKNNCNVVIEKKFKPCFVNPSNDDTVVDDTVASDNEKLASSNVKRSSVDVTEVEIIDCTSVNTTTISNINEALNYNKFGEEIVFKLPVKPANKIKFNLNKKSLIYAVFYYKCYKLHEYKLAHVTFKSHAKHKNGRRYIDILLIVSNKTNLEMF